MLPHKRKGSPYEFVVFGKNKCRKLTEPELKRFREQIEAIQLRKHKRYRAHPLPTTR